MNLDHRFLTFRNFREMLIPIHFEITDFPLFLLMHITSIKITILYLLVICILKAIVVVLKTARHLSLSRTTWTRTHPPSLFIWVVFQYYIPVHPQAFQAVAFLHVFLLHSCFSFLIPLMHATLSAKIMPPDFITIIMYGLEYKSFGSWLHNFLQSPLIAVPWGLNIFFRILFQNTRRSSLTDGHQGSSQYKTKVKLCLTVF